MQGRAMIVDDDPVECELVAGVLSSTGMEVVAFTRSSDATDRLIQEKFSVVLFDFHMAHPDGLELSRQVRGPGLNQMTPVILISDDQSTGAVSKGFAAGASVFVYKPVDRARLLKLVQATQGTIEQERRRFRRVPISAKVVIIFEGGEVEGETIDVSLNGLMAKATWDARVGSAVTVRLYLDPEAKPIVSSGSVVRIVAPDRVGIHLDPLPLGESSRLQDFLLPLILKVDPETIGGKSLRHR